MLKSFQIEKGNDEDGVLGTRHRETAVGASRCAERNTYHFRAGGLNAVGLHEEHSVSVQKLMDFVKWRFGAI